MDENKKVTFQGKLQEIYVTFLQERGTILQEHLFMLLLV